MLTDVRQIADEKMREKIGNVGVEAEMYNEIRVRVVRWVTLRSLVALLVWTPLRSIVVDRNIASVYKSSFTYNTYLEIITSIVFVEVVEVDCYKGHVQIKVLCTSRTIKWCIHSSSLDQS